MSSPFARQMFNSRCMCLNHYHHKSPGNLFQNRVGWGWVTFATFHLSCYIVMENPHSYILKTHATIASSSSFISIFGVPIFMLLIFPYRWSKSEVIGMPNNLLAPQKLCFFQLHPRLLLIIHLTTCLLDLLQAPYLFLLTFVLRLIFWRRAFFLYVFCWSNTPFCFLRATSNIMMLLIFLNSTSKSLVECV